MSQIGPAAQCCSLQLCIQGSILMRANHIVGEHTIRVVPYKMRVLEIVIW